MIAISRRCLITLAAAVALAGFGGESRADFLIGSTFHVTGLNTPNTFDEVVTLSPGTTTIDGGRLSLTQTIVEQGGGLWLNLAFKATQGRLIPNANLNGSFGVTGVQLDGPAISAAKMLYWTIGGEPAAGIRAFGAFTPVRPNPIDPLGRDVYLQIPPSSGPTSVVEQTGSVSTYSLLYSGNIDPTLVDGIVMAFKITAVPEPSSYVTALAGMSIAALFGTGRSIRGRSGRSR